MFLSFSLKAEGKAVDLGKRSLTPISCVVSGQSLYFSEPVPPPIKWDNGSHPAFLGELLEGSHELMNENTVHKV